jgi:hypothetical protein
MKLRSPKKVLFLALAACIAFSVVFAEVVIADDIDHDCMGEGCPFCLGIETVHNFFKSLELGTLAVFLSACPVFLTQTPRTFTGFLLSLHSPVALKIRLNS